jgi:xylose isomerase
MRAIDLGVELGASTYVFWGGREGAEVDGAGKLTDALAWFRDALNYLAAYATDQGYDLRFALEPKPNEPRGDLFLPTVGSLLGFIATLDDPDRFGVNPEFAHETMAGLSFPHAVAQAIDAGKLFHIDLNDQKMSRFDQDLRFGAENPKAALMTVALLDLDHFKRFNDTSSHDAGDGLLRDAAAVWQQALREVDVLARWGGEEFVVLFPDTTPDVAALILDRPRMGTPLGQTCSVGVASIERAAEGDGLVDAIRRADSALYEAKGTGRGRIVVAD